MNQFERYEKIHDLVMKEFEIIYNLNSRSNYNYIAKAF